MFGIPLLLVLGLIAWIELGSWRRIAEVEHSFASARPGAFLLGLRTSEGSERLASALLQFRLSGDPSEREDFHTTAREMTETLSRTRPLSDPERQLAAEAGSALAAFVERANPWLESPIRGIRRGTAAEVHAEIQTAAAPLRDAADRLARLQQSTAEEFFTSAERSLAALRRMLLISFLVFSLLTAGACVLAYHTFVAPLRTQLDQTRDVLDRQGRLAALGVLAAGVAHEIRNPLAALKFRLFSLKKTLPPSAAQREELAIFDRELERLERIVNDFLQFARPAEPARRSVPVEALFESVASLFREDLLQRNIALDHSPGDVRTIQADRDQLQQVLINLVRNAAEAGPPGSRISLHARFGAARIAGPRPEPVVILDVADTGPGIPAEAAQRIFDPFFSTREGGTGLGLSIASRIVEKHGGVIQYSTQSGRGTTFSIVLPRTNEDESPTSPDRG